ncbi:MAG: cupin domain-containing protein, partial [Gaiellaceae bacterium]
TLETAGKDSGMTGYAIRNLKEIEDSAVKFGLSPQMESRFARKDLGAETLGLSYQRLAPNVRQPFGHRHEQQEEVYVVLSGGGRVSLDGEVVEVRPWDAVRVAPDTTRAFEAGPDGLELLAFGAHTVSTDVETVQGFWAS